VEKAKTTDMSLAVDPHHHQQALDHRAASITSAGEAFPSPSSDADQPMLAHLIRTAKELKGEQGRPTYFRLAAHAWYEGPASRRLHTSAGPTD
jgi:hypothetical protein